MPSWVENGSKENGESSKQQRKRWEIEDKKLLKNLRYQLAEDGNSECQFLLAKQLLDDTDDATRPIQGISYLKKAAQQGHEMALELLAACYRTRKGIVSSNESDIRKFLEMSPSERAARLAAQELFNSLANGNEYVTVEQLENRMREIYKMQRTKKSYDNNDEISIKENISDQEDFELRDEASRPSTSSSPLRVKSSRHDNDDDHISQANLINAAHNYSNGRIPSVNHALTLSVPHPQTLEHVPYLHRPFFHPSMFFALLYYRFIEILSSISLESLKKYQIFVLLAIYAIVSSGDILTSLPTFAYYSTLTIMVVASCKILKSKHQYIDFRIWSGLFLSYNDRVYAEESEGLFLRKNLQPFVWFFFAFAMNLMVYPLIADQWLPHSEITIIGTLLCFVTLLCFIRTSGRVIDLTIFLSFALNVFAKYPYDLDTLMMSNKWRFMKISDTSFSVANGIELTMNYRGLLYVAISFLFLLLARRENWRGIYQFLIPHCVTLAWLQIVIINSQSATAFGLLRSTLGVVGIFFFLPLFGLATLLVPIFAALEFFSVKDSTNRIFITISTSLIAIVTSCFMAVSQRTGRFVTYVHIMICALAMCFLFRPHLISRLNEGGSHYSSSYLQQTTTVQSLDVIEDDVTLSWDVFNKYCVGSNTNRIDIQLRCSHIHGAEVHWEGTVMDVGISQIKNWRRDLINFLPNFIGNFLTCYFGDANQLNCFEGENCEIKEFMDTHKRCNLDNWNIYKYEIELKMPATSSGGLFQNSRQESKIILEAEHAFGNFTSKINTSDKVWFKGTLKTSIAQKDQVSCKNRDDWKISRVEINAIGCMQCTDKNLSPMVIAKKFGIDSYIKSLKRGIKYGLNQIFYPLITFK